MRRHQKQGTPPLSLCLAGFLLSGMPTAVRAQTPPKSVPIRPTRLLMAHYMPWYEANPAQKSWGWHWTMNHYQPEKMVGERREAASRYYPLIGLYDSNDPDALECQILLMKLSGIDGVIIDWYGTVDYLDYGLIQRNSQHLVRLIKKAGLRFAVMFEDQTVPKLVEGGKLEAKDVVAHGQRQLQWLQANWFTDPAYLKRENRPVFLTFGSGYYSGEQWTQIFSILPQAPQFFTESYRREPAVGGFWWPQPAKGTDESLKEMEHFYSSAEPWTDMVAGAFPRFEDIYEAAGVHKSWGEVEDRNGKIYTDTLERALKTKASVIQLITWNDWGEGTNIEPSVEFGYRDLETTQRLRRQYIEPGFAAKAASLRLPVMLYDLRKKYKGDAEKSAKLEEASRLLFDGKADKAGDVLKKLSESVK